MEVHTKLDLNLTMSCEAFPVNVCISISGEVLKVVAKVLVPVLSTASRGLKQAKKKKNTKYVTMIN